MGREQCAIQKEMRLGLEGFFGDDWEFGPNGPGNVVRVRGESDKTLGTFGAHNDFYKRLRMPQERLFNMLLEPWCFACKDELHYASTSVLCYIFGKA
jgi:hypothetical protein